MNKKNTITIDGKQVTYDKVNATLLSKPAEFYDLFEKINAHAEVTDDMVKRLLTYVGSKINSPDFWNIRDDEDKAEVQSLLSQLEAANENDEKKRLFGTIMNRLFKNNDISVELAAMASGGDVLAAGMPVQNRMQEWGRIVFGNESHTADGETPAFSKEASIDLRSAQALFNTLIPPERLKDLYMIDHEIATLRKSYDDEIQQVNEARLDEASRKKQLEDIYKRMNRDQQLSEKIVKKIDLRAMYYDAILEAYNVEGSAGVKTAEGGDQQLIDQIRERKTLLKGKTWSNVNTESETELLKLFSDTGSDENAIRARIKADRKRTRGALLRLEERFGFDFIKNNRAGNDVVIGMGLKGIELLKRRAQSHRMRNAETVEHDLDAIMAHTLPTEVTVYGRVEGARVQQEPDTNLADLLQKLEDSAGEDPADEQGEKGTPPPEKEKDQAQLERPPAKQAQNEEASGTNDYARLYEPNYSNLPKSSSPEASSAVEIAIEQMDNGNIDGSLEWFRRALDHDSLDLQAMFGIAVTSGDVWEQISMLELILKKQPDFEAAKIYLSNLRLETPVNTHSVAVEEPPQPNAPYIEIAQLMQDPTPENQRKAKELAEALTTKNDKDAEAWYLRAMLIRGTDKGAIDVKKRHLKRALKADPQHQLAKDELEKLTRTSTTAQIQENASITRHPLMSRIEEANLNKSAQEVLEQVKESTDITDWIDRIMTKETIHRLLTTEDPADSKLNDLKKIIEEKAEAYASYMQDEFDWPANKHKENVRIIHDIMLNEIKLRIHQSRQEVDQQTNSEPEKSKSDATYIDKLSQALLQSEAHLVITKEIEQAFIDGNIQVIEQYIATGKDILFVDSSNLPDYDSRKLDQVRAEGLKALYLQTLNGAVQNRKDKELLIAQLEKSGLQEMLATVLMEDLRMLSPTAVTETDYHKHSARLSGATAKMEAMELLLKLTTPMFAPKTAYLLEKGSPLSEAFQYLETAQHSSAPGSQVSELENQYREYIKTIRNALQIAEKKKPVQASSAKAEGEIIFTSIEDIVRIITDQQMLDEREILHLKEIAHTPEYQSDLDVIVTSMLEILEAKRNFKIIPEHIQFNRDSLIMAIERIVIAHSASPANEHPNNGESLSSQPVEKQQLNIDQLVSLIQNNNLLSDEDLFLLIETLHEPARTSKSDETGPTPSLDLNLREIAKDIHMHINTLVASEIIDPQITYTQESLIAALKQIASTSEKPILAALENTLDLEATIQVLNQLGYDKKIMTGKRGTYLNVPVKMVQQSVDAARHKKEIDDSIRLDAATIKIALKEMARRHAEKQSVTLTTAASEMNRETNKNDLQEQGNVDGTETFFISYLPDHVHLEPVQKERIVAIMKEAGFTIDKKGHMTAPAFIPQTIKKLSEINWGDIPEQALPFACTPVSGDRRIALTIRAPIEHVDMWLGMHIALLADKWDPSSDTILTDLHITALNSESTMNCISTSIGDNTITLDNLRGHDVPNITCPRGSVELKKFEGMLSRVDISGGTVRLHVDSLDEFKKHISENTEIDISSGTLELVLPDESVVTINTNDIWKKTRSTKSFRSDPRYIINRSNIDTVLDFVEHTVDVSAETNDDYSAIKSLLSNNRTIDGRVLRITQREGERPQLNIPHSLRVYNTSLVLSHAAVAYESISMESAKATFASLQSDNSIYLSHGASIDIRKGSLSATSWGGSSIDIAESSNATLHEVTIKNPITVKNATLTLSQSMFESGYLQSDIIFKGNSTLILLDNEGNQILKRTFGDQILNSEDIKRNLNTWKGEDDPLLAMPESFNTPEEKYEWLLTHAEHVPTELPPQPIVRAMYRQMRDIEEQSPEAFARMRFQINEGGSLLPSSLELYGDNNSLRIGETTTALTIDGSLRVHIDNVTERIDNEGSSWGIYSTVLRQVEVKGNSTVHIDTLKGSLHVGTGKGSVFVRNWESTDSVYTFMSGRAIVLDNEKGAEYIRSRELTYVLPKEASYDVLTGLHNVEYPASEGYQYPGLSEQYKTFTQYNQRYVMVELQPMERKSTREFGLFQWINNKGTDQLVFKNIVKQ